MALKYIPFPLGTVAMVSVNSSSFAPCMVTFPLLSPVSSTLP
jgi:hypothetical protein